MISLVKACWQRRREKQLNRMLLGSGSAGRIVLGDPFLRVDIFKSPSASLTIRGQLHLVGFQGSRDAIHLSFGPNSETVIDGDLMLGPGCRINVSNGASLYLGGRKHESMSGMTEHSRIMARKRVRIGTDFICAWNVFITDSDWHIIDGQDDQADTVIGDHVWIAPNCSILKGTEIGNGCIIATGSVAHKTRVPDHCLAGGNPFKVLKTDRHWRRDLPAIEAETAHLAARA